MKLDSFVAGDSFTHAVCCPEYPSNSSAGWVLKCRFTPRTPGAAPIALTGSPVADGHYAVTAAPIETSRWAADVYALALWVERVTSGESSPVERHTIAEGQITIRPDPRTIAAGYDSRSQARKALDDAKAALAAWTPTRKRYKIGSREMEFNGTADIIKLITYWEQQVLTEDINAGRASKPGRRIFTRI